MGREVLGLAAAVRTLCGEENLREMTITERATPAETFQSAFRKASATAFRRSISSYLR